MLCVGLRTKQPNVAILISYIKLATKLDKNGIINTVAYSQIMQKKVYFRLIQPTHMCIIEQRLSTTPTASHLFHCHCKHCHKDHAVNLQIGCFI